ncbi:MAG: ATP-binding protein [Acidimicrobiales bacterium]
MAATGSYRRGFRPSALRIGVELSSRLGAAIQRVLMHQEMQASARDQSRTVRRLRRLATAATNLAGAPTTEAVLQVACVEACVIQEADGAIAKWWMADGSEVSAQAGEVDQELAKVAFQSVTNGRPARSRGWVAYPLPSTDPWQQAALVVFVGDELSTDEELVLSSLASLIPVAFERAVGTEAAVVHEARLRAVVDSSPVALIGLRTDGAVTSANRAALDLFGWDLDPAQWSLAGGLLVALVDLSDAVRLDGSVVSRTVSVDGRDLSVSGAPMPAISPSDGDTVLIAGVDLTEVRRAERALVHAQRLDAMGQVAGRVAHDFNNLLTLIIGYTELLARTSNRQQQPLVDNIGGAARRAARLTQQMLGMTRRQDSGVVCDLGGELSGLYAVLARLAGPKVLLTVSRPDEAVKVHLDPGELEQIVVNLTINACDAMGGDGTLTITVTQVDDPAGTGPSALLTVADDGPGMTPEVKAKCLDPFFTTKPRGEGTGLGLPTVHGLVSERGGRLDIDSIPGEGTAMRVWLPLSRESLTAHAGGDGESWPAGRRISGRVLFVEDEDELRELGEELLSSVGLDVVTAPSAELALLKLESSRRPFDALVTDVMLPGRSGVDLAGEARRKHPELPVMYMTGYSGSPEGGVSPGPGAWVLRKPYRPDALRYQVAELLEATRRQGSKR